MSSIFKKKSRVRNTLRNNPVIFSSHEYDEDMGDEFGVVIGILVVIVLTFWGMIHLIDKFTVNFIPWWIEPFLIIPAGGIFAIMEVYGSNPLWWWPLVWGTTIKVDPPLNMYSMQSEELYKKFGGPKNIYISSSLEIKFRRKKDITKYVLFFKS